MKAVNSLHLPTDCIRISVQMMAKKPLAQILIPERDALTGNDALVVFDWITQFVQ